MTNICLNAVFFEESDGFGCGEVTTFAVAGANFYCSNQFAVFSQGGFWDYTRFPPVRALHRMGFFVFSEGAIEGIFGNTVKMGGFLNQYSSLLAANRECIQPPSQFY